MGESENWKPTLKSSLNASRLFLSVISSLFPSQLFWTFRSDPSPLRHRPSPHRTTRRRRRWRSRLRSSDRSGAKEVSMKVGGRFPEFKRDYSLLFQSRVWSRRMERARENSFGCLLSGHNFRIPLTTGLNSPFHLFLWSFR